MDEFDEKNKRILMCVTLEGTFYIRILGIVLDLSSVHKYPPHPFPSVAGYRQQTEILTPL